MLLDSEGYIKLTDLGISILMNNQGLVEGVNSGTVPYMAQEIKSGGHVHGKPADIFAIAVTTYEIFHGDRPFNEEEEFGEDDVKLVCRINVSNCIFFLRIIFLLPQCIYLYIVHIYVTDTPITVIYDYPFTSGCGCREEGECFALLYRVKGVFIEGIEKECNRKIPILR
jgi:serine/threonine protein kinase